MASQLNQTDEAFTMNVRKHTHAPARARTHDYIIISKYDEVSFPL